VVGGASLYHLKFEKSNFGIVA